LKPFNLYQICFLLFLSACNQGVSGCSSSEVNFEAKDKIHGAIQVRLTQEGLNFLGNQVSPIVQEALPDSLSTCLSGNNDYCNQNQCADGSTGCPVSLSIADVDLLAVEPDRIRAMLTLDRLDLLLDVSRINCNIHITSNQFPVGVDLALSTPEPERNLRFKLDQVSYQLSNLDFDLQGNALCNGIGDVISIPIVGDLILGLVQSALNNVLIGALQLVLNQTLCIACDSPENENACQRAGGQCLLGQCIDPNAFGACMPKAIGLTGSLDLGDLLQSISPSASGSIDYFVSPGSYVKVEQEGLSMGVIGGMNTILNRCVAGVTPPPVTEVPKAEAFSSNQDPSGRRYDIGIGVSQRFIDRALWSVQQSGALCLGISGENIEMLNTRTLQVLLPSLSKVTHGAAPVAVVLAPQSVPALKLGKNIVTQLNIEQDPMVQEPLFTLSWEDLWIDFYGFADDRWFRLFSLKADLSFPLALDFDPTGKVIPMPGDINNALSNIEVANGEILLDDPNRIAMFLPTLIGPLIGGALSSLTDPIALPSLMGIQLVPSAGSITGINENGMDFLAIYADLERAPTEMMNGSGNKSLGFATVSREVQTEVELSEIIAIDPNKTLIDGIRSHLKVMLPSSRDEQLEYSWQIDQQAWHPFVKPLAQETHLLIEDPALFVQGKHQLQIRARRIGDIQSLDQTPTTIDFIIDALPPMLTLIAQDQSSVLIEAEDLISRQENLKMRYRWDGQSWQEATTDQRLSLALEADATQKAYLAKWSVAVEGDLLEVEIQDEAGQITSKAISFETKTQNLIGRADPNQAPSSGAGGCACHQLPTNHAHPHWSEKDFLPFILLVLFSRRVRQTLLRAIKKINLNLLLLLIASYLQIACEDQNKKPSKDIVLGDQGIGCEACLANQVCIDQKCQSQSCSFNPSICDTMSCGDGQKVQCGTQGVCECVNQPLCPEGCEEGKYCCFQRNACETVAQGTCPSLNCPIGQTEVVVNAGEMDSDQCALVDFSCECQPLPDLPIGAVGRYSDLFVTEQKAYLSAYSDDYGDLVVGIGTPNDGLKWMWVDGIPADGMVAGNLTGPRNGIKTAGANVGKYTSLVVDASKNIHVVYTDVDQNALKYALGTLSGNAYTWQNYVLAENAGQWADLQLIPNGNALSLVYRKVLASTAGKIPTQIIYRASKNLSPATVGDWQDEQVLQTVEYDETLVISTYPEGTALFNDHHWAQDGSKLGVSWYDRSGGNFYFVEGQRQDESMTFSEVQLLAGWLHETRKADMGANGAFAFDAQNQAHFCYQDGSKDNLRYLAPALNIDEVIDDGIRLATDDREQSLHIVGDDCEVQFDNQGRLIVIYQDSTSHELLLSQRDTNGNWTRIYLRQRDLSGTTYMGRNYGFFAKSQWNGSDLWISHYVYDTLTTPASQGVELFSFRPF
jgi:hypothetical protein